MFIARKLSLRGNNSLNTIAAGVVPLLEEKVSVCNCSRVRPTASIPSMVGDGSIPPPRLLVPINTMYMRSSFSSGDESSLSDASFGDFTPFWSLLLNASLFTSPSSSPANCDVGNSPFSIRHSKSYVLDPLIPSINGCFHARLPHDDLIPKVVVNNCRICSSSLLFAFHMRCLLGSFPKDVPAQPSVMLSP